LDLSNNQLRLLTSKNWESCKNLKYLDLSNNQLATLPKEIGKLEKLEDLNLSGNPFTTFPQEIVGLKHLQILKLKNIPALLSEKETIRKLLPDVKIIYFTSEE
ncbi:leucine-rich repeat domain-containing protein, partial [Leptospira santarosai]|uniref:leucine-rich repeat domain-containing protein n=1 Tax=Leptospira santarosai TaxID=28183 RepID=UPI000517DFCC